MVRNFEKWISKRHAKPPFDIKDVFVPTRRDRILQDLIDGTLVERSQGNIGHWAIGADNSVDIRHWRQGRHGRTSSSYYAHLVALNERIERKNRSTAKVVPADKDLEDEDLLQMVSAGLLPWAIVDTHKAKLWVRILKDLTRAAMVKDGASSAPPKACP